MSQPARSTVAHRCALGHRVLGAFFVATLLMVALSTAPADAQLDGDVVISEIFYNPDGQAEGHEYVELHNTTSNPVDVAGWQFLTGVSYTFPAATTIGANSYIVLAQNSADFEAVFGFLPTGEFSGSLSNAGENLTLVDGTNNIVDQVIYDDVSPWPLSADGAGDSLASIDATLAASDPARWVAGTPTPQVANDPILSVVFSVQRGWFSSTQTVTLTPSIAGATIFYNMTGSGVATTEYIGPITVSDNNDVRVIQAQASLNGQASAISTHTYVFKPDTGAPVVVTWPNGLATAPGETEDTRSFEFIAPPSTGLAPAWANAGVSASQGGVAAGESDKFFFRGVYGNGTLTGDLFGDNYYGLEPTTEIDQLFLRNNQGDDTHLRQIFAHDALLEAGQLSPHGRFVQYYKDGEDSGVRHMQERPEGGFMESYTGVEKDQWLAWATNEVTPGSGVSNGLGNPTMGAPFSSWADVTTSIDPDSFIDYLLVQWQSKTSDYRSIKNFRTAGPVDFNDASELDNYRYHFFNWDMDYGYNNAIYGRQAPAGWGWAGYTSPDYLAHELDQFIEFRLLVSDRITCAHFDDGPLSQTAFAPRLEARRQELIAAGGANEQSFVSSLITWIGDRNDWLLNEYRSPGADRTVYGQFRPDQAPWKPPSSFAGPLLQQVDPLSYEVTNGVLSVTNVTGGQVYYQTNGGDPRQIDGTLSADAIAYDGPVGLAAGRANLIVRSFDESVSDTFQAWSPACNESRQFDIAVPGTPGVSPGEGLVINEINYNPDPDFSPATASYLAEFVEVFNSTDAAINASGFRFSTGLDFTFPPGTVIDPGEFGIVIPEGSIVAFFDEYNDTTLADVIGEYRGRLDDGGETITLVDAVGGLIDEVTYDDVDPWVNDPDGTGPSLSLIDPSLDNSLPASWKPSRSSGTPAAVNDTGPRGDVDCDNELTIADALIIAQFSVGLRSGSSQCPLLSAATGIFEPAADFDDSGIVDVGDAIRVAQCTVGLPNGFCEDG